MKASEIRQNFLDFFEQKGHKIVQSAPLVVKNDPTLMFTNAGMNQFKDYFLGNEIAPSKRIADTQKCLRVSGKHNDLEEVGHDTYHHTMFEMLGNWSFGDYFKVDAIDWAWEFLTEVIGLEKDRLYVTVFEGSKDDKLDADQEALNLWKKHVPEDRILFGNKKDNFWEMGDQGPCGPCSEIHVDIRDNEQRKKIDGATLVNQSDPLVIEIWNLVFIQFNRKADGSLELLPDKHVDTGMGFERLCMAVQKKKSNYDTDVFQPIINTISQLAGVQYGKDEKADIAMRVIADHLRAISFSIADGQIPSNNKAGYVIRRILRRAVRYGYTFLNQNEPFIYRLVPALCESMGKPFPELELQKELIAKVIREEESTFIKTLANGMKLLDVTIDKAKSQKKSEIGGVEVFELYDTYGFPLDLTELILREKGMTADIKGFDVEMEKQKNRSRSATTMETDDWVVLIKDENILFTGYDKVVEQSKITRYRKTKVKNDEFYQIVLDKTPFYAESGGQTGDTGYLECQGKKYPVIDTKKENNLIIHILKQLPENVAGEFTSFVNEVDRLKTASNHSATHLLHLSLRKILGTHVEQKGSLVEPSRLRFDFSHFQKMSAEEIKAVELEVNNLIRKNSSLDENRNTPYQKAIEMGAMALFGEKYTDSVRVIKFGDSVELCGGTHIQSTGQIGLFKIVSESAVAAGIRRIEAITGEAAYAFLYQDYETVQTVKSLLKVNKDVVLAVEGIIEENNNLSKKIEIFNQEKIVAIKQTLKNKVKSIQGMNVIIEKGDFDSAAMMKDICFQLKGEMSNLFLVLATEVDDKANIAVLISDNLVKEKSLNAVAMIKEVSAMIQGGGGGQPFFATAGGKNPKGIDEAIQYILAKIS